MDLVTATTTPLTSRELVQALHPFATPDTRRGLQLFVVDLLVFALGMGLALFATDLAVRSLGGVLAGLKINGLYTLGHDAGHGVLTRHRRLNQWLATLGYLPALYNHHLWHYDHQVLHHVKTNGPQVDVHRPASLAEYRASPWWKKAWLRLTRSFNPLAFALYITYHSRIEQSKFFPHAAVHPAGVRARAWPVTLLLLAYLLSLLGWMAWRNAGFGGFLLDLLFGLVLPHFVFTNVVAVGSYLQHTHPAVPWFRSNDPAERSYEQATLCVDFRLPKWLDSLSHEALAHPAHHVLPAIPCYRLREAQEHLGRLLGRRGVSATPAELLSIFRRCKLYDYEQRCWLDFDGRPTTPSVPLP